jgi:agmatine deiminase
MPAEWELQEAVWLSWPSGHPDCFPDTLEKVESVFAEIAAAVSRYETVRINAPAARHDSIRRQISGENATMERVELYNHPNDDVWCRDHGPLFVKHRETGKLAVTNWGFNGWGDKFGPYDQDNQIPVHIASTLGMDRFDADMILEGGSIELNSHGQLITTEAVLLNENRNPQLSRSEIETRLKEMLGATEIFWLGAGIEGDDTDGHIDDLARFVNDSTIVISREKDGRNANHRVLQENRDRLSDFRLPDGSKPEIIDVDLPDACLAPDWRLPVLPASYVNFLILNEAVLVPVFGQKKRDTAAVGLFGELFPGREIVPINTIDIVREGGAIHCISQQQPA